VTAFGRREVMVHVRRDDEFLVVRRTDHGYWHTVAGGVEGDEAWEDAAMRELREETGLAVDRVVPIGGFEYVREAWERDPGMRVDVRAFLAEAPAGWEPELDHEHDGYRWCAQDDAIELLYWPEPKELLRAI
jgi:8-oxo-dGTP pyrophosphatase MutT (NUDIX family)